MRKPTASEPAVEPLKFELVAHGGALPVSVARGLGAAVAEAATTAASAATSATGPKARKRLCIELPLPLEDLVKPSKLRSDPVGRQDPPPRAARPRSRASPGGGRAARRPTARA